MTEGREITTRQETKDKKENVQMQQENVKKGAHSIIWMAIRAGKSDFWKSILRRPRKAP